MANPPLPESETPNEQEQKPRPVNISRSSSPYDSQTKPGKTNINYNPSSTKIPGLPQTGSASSTSPSPRDADRLASGLGTPTRDYRPKFQTGQPDNQSLTTNPATGNDTGNSATPVDLDTDSNTYDRPGNVPDDEARSDSSGPGGNPATDKSRAKSPDKTAPSRSDLANEEKSSGSATADKAGGDEADKLGRGYTGNAANPKDIGKRGESLYRRLLKTKARKAALGLPIGGGLIALFFIIFISLAPLKLLNIVTNLENRFFSSANHAMDKESEKLFEGYIKKRLFVMGACKGTIDIECKAVKSFNPVTRMWKGWAHRRIEEKMANKFGITFEAKAGTFGNTYYVKFPGMQGDGADVTKFVTGDAQLDELIANSAEGQRIKLTRNQVRKVINTALKDANLYDRTAYKYKFLQMMAEKYGLRFCIMFCKPKDALSDKIAGIGAKPEDAYKLTMTERVQMMRLRILQEGFFCVFGLSSKCTPDNKPKYVPCEEGVNCELGAVATTDMELEIQAALRASAASLGLEGAAELKSVQEFKDAAEKKGLDSEFLDKQIADIIGEEGAHQGASKLIPIIGWITIAAQIVDAAGNAGPAVKHLSYLANTSMAAAYFQSLATTSNECKSGHCNGTELASFSDAFNRSATEKDGGTASAEESPLYNKYMNNGPLRGNSSAIKCKGNKPMLSTGICSEEQMAQGQPLIDEISSTVKDFAGGIIYKMAHAWNSMFSWALHIIGSLFGWILTPLADVLFHAANALCEIKIPFTNIYVFPFIAPYCEVRDAVSAAIPHVVEFFQQHVVPSAFSLTMSGARSFNFAAAGADVLGNDTVRNVMGGVIAAPGRVTELQQEQYQQDLADYQSQPLLKRLVDTNSQFSPATKLAMAMPAGSADLSYGAMNMFSNPFGSLSSLFGNLFNKHAAAANEVDPFGIPQYEVPDAAIDAIGTDQATFWDQHCADANNNPANGQAAQAYAKRAVIDENSGAPINPPDPNDPFLGTNPCLIIQAALCPNSTFNDDMVCPSEDLNGNQADGTANNSSSGGTSGSSGSSSTDTTGTGSTNITGNCSDGGQYAAIVGAGANFAGVDQGIDFTPSSSSGFNICAPASGIITLADQTGHHFDNTSGQAEVILKLDKKPDAPNSSQYIYFAEIIQINSNIHADANNPVHVNKGDVIGHNDQNPGIEVGWAKDASHGFMCALGGQTACGFSFDNWLKAGGG